MSNLTAILLSLYLGYGAVYVYTRCHDCEWTPGGKRGDLFFVLLLWLVWPLFVLLES